MKRFDNNGRLNNISLLIYVVLDKNYLVKSNRLLVEFSLTFTLTFTFTSTLTLLVAALVVLDSSFYSISGAFTPNAGAFTLRWHIYSFRFVSSLI